MAYHSRAVMDWYRDGNRVKTHIGTSQKICGFFLFLNYLNIWQILISGYNQYIVFYVFILSWYAKVTISHHYLFAARMRMTFWCYSCTIWEYFSIRTNWPYIYDKQSAPVCIFLASIYQTDPSDIFPSTCCGQWRCFHQHPSWDNRPRFGWKQEFWRVLSQAEDLSHTIIDGLSVSEFH